VLLLLIAAVAVGAVVAQQQIIAQWPKAAEYYKMVGLGEEEATPGLELRDVVSNRRVEDGVQVLEIMGQVANVGDASIDVPRLRAVLRDAKDLEIQDWSFSADQNRLEPGAMTSFQTSLRDPPAEATGLSITFEGPAGEIGRQ